MIAGTWLFWLMGALYMVGPVLGCMLAAMAAWQLYLRGGRIAGPVWAWIAGMAVMLIALWIGHSSFSLGTAQTVKSSVGWAKGWALMALFIFAGSVLEVRAEVIARAVCRLGLQTLIALPIFLAAPAVGLPETLYTSPLQVLGGSSSEYFSTILYIIDPESGSPRWQFFAPWAPAAGMVAVAHMLVAAREPHLGWRSVGMAAGLLIVLLTASRLALVAIVAIPATVLCLRRIDRPSMWLLAAPAVAILGLIGPVVLEFVDQAMSDFASARAGSSRVRSALGRIALERWQNEAYWYGHGIVEPGPHMVEYMPIGSHHSWYGLLYVKGLTGALALAIPLGLTLTVLAWRAHRNSAAQTGLAMTLVLVFYSFGENLEMLAYLYWPALFLIGAAFANENAMLKKKGPQPRGNLPAAAQ